MTTKFIQHFNPIWKEKANFIIRTKVDDPNNVFSGEQLWARKISEKRFEIFCIPFFAYDLSLGDEVETDEEFFVKKVTKPSGQFTFRIWLKDTPDGIRTLIIKHLMENDYLIEQHSESLLAINATDANHAQLIADYLMELEKKNNLEYETGKS